MKTVGWFIYRFAEKIYTIIAFGFACFAGYLLGSLGIHFGSLGYVSLESTGGVLIGALILEHIGSDDPAGGIWGNLSVCSVWNCDIHDNPE